MAKVLLVDDAMFMRKMLGDTLSKMGHEVIGEAGDGKDGVAEYKKLKPDLTLMDITMPNMNGLEAVKAIMTDHPEAKVIMCSAMGQKEMVVDAVRAGAKDFIVKPFNMERVQEAVAKVMGD